MTSIGGMVMPFLRSEASKWGNGERIWGLINASHCRRRINDSTAPKAEAMATPAPHLMRFQSL
jgi:hypothetical protein